MTPFFAKSRSGSIAFYHYFARAGALFALPLKIAGLAKSASGGSGTLQSTAHASKLSTNRAHVYVLARLVESLLAGAVLSRVPKPPASALRNLGTLRSTAPASKLSTNRAHAYVLARFLESLLAGAVLCSSIGVAGQ